ncbi:MAG TPA: amidohydrolase family protein [Candidatus Dormibacteraeota bacterium]|jgi:predicted TIM-barrel fold metal-dependent hydrolase|nr:amidohydrolase family protein [Candidatus Dormibacteraeota bacterium]
MRIPIPDVLQRKSSDEYTPVPWNAHDLRALDMLREALPDRASTLRLELPGYVASRRGLATTLRAIDEAHGGGFYEVPADAEWDARAAEACFGGDELVIDVQTHMVNPARMVGGTADRLRRFLQNINPERWGAPADPWDSAAAATSIDAGLLTATHWLDEIFRRSETWVAVISCFPGRESANESILTNEEINACKRLLDRFAGTGRIYTHALVHPNLGQSELDGMAQIRDEFRPAAWKAYTLWQARETVPENGRPRGWFFDDEQVGIPFLETVRSTGPRMVCVHKGVDGISAGNAIPGSSPRDIGPAAAMFPEITFVVYHSGYQPDASIKEEAYQADREQHFGVDRLVASLAQAGTQPGANVYAELGSTWFMVMRSPLEAAHVLGKLLKAVGEDRIVWGTDSIWYGPPQFMIDAFRAFQIPAWMQAEYGYPALTREIKRKILGANAAPLYGVDLDAARSARVSADPAWLDPAEQALAGRFP